MWGKSSTSNGGSGRYQGEHRKLATPGPEADYRGDTRGEQAANVYRRTVTGRLQSQAGSHRAR